MGEKSYIEWTDATWNMLRGTVGRWFCTKVDELCRRCYSEALNHRFGGPDFRVGADTIRLDERILLDPLRWRRPRKIFVCSMTDLFHEAVPFEWIDRIFGVMRKRPDHTFQVLTKRHARMLEYACSRKWASALTNVWWGCSVGTKKSAAERTHTLRCVPVAVRWLSIEPLLEDLGDLDLRGISWAVVGSESGHGARPMDMDWVRSIRDQSLQAGARFFFKQAMVERRIVSLPELDGRRWADFPTLATATA